MPQVLRQKRMYENQRETLYNQQFNMEQTRFTVESIQDTVQTVQALKAANVQMKGAMKANKELDLSFIDNLQVRCCSKRELPDCELPECELLECELPQCGACGDGNLGREAPGGLH
jgi:hypothetical protein